MSESRPGREMVSSQRVPEKWTGRRDGFTLIELLVALSVLSLGLVALLNVTGENVRAAGHIRENVVAEILAENVLAEAMLEEEQETGTLSGEAPMGNRQWVWERHITPTANEGMQRVDVTVRPADEGEGGRAAARLTAFRGVGP